MTTGMAGTMKRIAVSISTWTQEEQGGLHRLDDQDKAVLANGILNRLLRRRARGNHRQSVAVRIIIAPDRVTALSQTGGDPGRPWCPIAELVRDKQLAIVASEAKTDQIQ